VGYRILKSGHFRGKFEPAADSRHSEVMETIWWGVIPCKISINQNLSEIPSSQKRQLAKPLAYYENKYGERDTAIVKVMKVLHIT